MSRITVARNGGYTVMSNYHLRDKNLSLKAKGLMSFMLSLPPEWDYSVLGLVACVKDGKTAVRSALLELEELGYLVRKQHRAETGLFAQAEYILYERPTREAPVSENQPAVEGMADRRPQINTKRINTKRINTNLLPTTLDTTYSEDTVDIPSNFSSSDDDGGDKRDTVLDRFEQFWKAYPRKVGKGDARKKFLRLKPSQELTDTMIRAVEMQAQSSQWQRDNGQFIPHPATWINQERWCDEVSTDCSQKQKTAKQTYTQDDYARYLAEMSERGHDNDKGDNR